ncbi:TIGR04255 family protein [Chitinimonas arctica]|uniref:TIGR04255 family protein n=1 Tax=Chitinimonas arctica TaxID=2594795 RepID=A0A516SJY1_9NEIS|nr:TIGR04255 family protein [Chitinimonas arctica]QDQ28454.1 TIGR04255 family protein [Chitinimonas arctica]
MATNTLGTWRKPPLAYVVAELVISPYYTLASKIPGLQDQLRSVFPKTIEATELVVESKTPSSQQLWQLLSADQHLGVQFGTRAISLHATTYLHSKDFLSRLAEVLDAIASADLGAFVERVGLRYIDLIVPNSDRLPTEYLVSQLHGVTPASAQANGSMWQAAFRFDSALVNLRVMAPAPQGIVLPPDFSAMPLKKPAIMVDAEESSKDDRPIGFIDTDCLKEIGRVFDAAELVGIYTELQKLASETFRAALSDHARREWQ